jgi:UDP-N-acetylmuramoyl-tripeptide--D-alanyl-D-alanine ligase
MMIAMRLSEACAVLNAEMHGTDVDILGVSTDTRTVQSRQLFVALHGPRHDAHDFLDAAAIAGAAAALIDREVTSPLPFIKVADTRRALAQLAAHWRADFPIPVVAVTGSNGKTTVKEMTASILSQRGTVLATRGNLNNDIGVPLTIFDLGPEHDFAVIEMGANHPGEIAQLCRIARPTVAVITLCAPAHLEGFGSIEGVARAKGEIFAGLPDDGLAVLNADDPYVDLWRKLAGKRRVTTFGLNHDADVSARMLASDDPGRTVFTMKTPRGEATVHLHLPGRHNVMNALAAGACALAAGVDMDAVCAGLESMRAVAGRLVIGQGYRGARIIDDTYNANPSSMKAAIDVLVGYPGEHWLVLGDMGELGAEAASLHYDVGEYARARGVQRLFGLGELSRQSVAGFGSGGRQFADAENLIDALRPGLGSAINVLVKGSRAMRMERIVQALKEET